MLSVLVEVTSYKKKKKKLLFTSSAILYPGKRAVLPIDLQTEQAKIKSKLIYFFCKN